MEPLETRLNVSAEQAAQLRRLQAEFAAACNLVSPIAQANRCWNRVALHHLTYRELRQRFPQLGSQMACNAVYSVARTYRVLLTHAQSPWNIERRPANALPALHFQDTAPVYFDRHTLSLKAGVLSMFTLDGRMRFELNLAEDDGRRFTAQHLREIVLLRRGEAFFLQFWFDEKSVLPASSGGNDVPQYLIVSAAPPVPMASATASSSRSSDAKVT
jgi:hypothetical protein